MQTPQSNLARITAVMKAWENLRPGKSFYGMDARRVQAIVQPSLDSRARIGARSDARRGAGDGAMSWMTCDAGDAARGG